MASSADSIVNLVARMSNRQLNWAMAAKRIRAAHGFETRSCSDFEVEFYRRLQAQNWSRYRWNYMYGDDDDYYQEDKVLHDCGGR